MAPSLHAGSAHPLQPLRALGLSSACCGFGVSVQQMQVPSQQRAVAFTVVRTAGLISRRAFTFNGSDSHRLAATPAPQMGRRLAAAVARVAMHCQVFL